MVQINGTILDQIWFFIDNVILYHCAGEILCVHFLKCQEIFMKYICLMSHAYFSETSGTSDVSVDIH